VRPRERTQVGRTASDTSCETLLPVSLWPIGHESETPQVSGPTEGHWPSLDYDRHLCDGVAVTEGERETLAIALDHAWRWYENRRGRAVLLLQILILWLAILGAAYGVVVQAGLYGLAGSIGVLAAVSVAATDLEASKLRTSAGLAAEAVADLQGRLADALAMESMRLQQREQAGHAPTPTFLGFDSGRWLAFGSIVVALGASLYTWVALP